MGLSLHVRAYAPASLDAEAVHVLVRRWHAAADDFAAAKRVDRVFAVSNDADDLARFATTWITVPHPDDPDVVSGVAVTPLEGAIFLVRLGQGCEPFVLGLCRYPAEVNSRDDGRLLLTHLDGWRLASSCKTQYAGAQAWEPFRRCHLAAIDLALAGESLGAEITLTDESGYWPGRDERALRTTLGRLDRAVAGLAGALKDTVNPATGQPVSVQAPILEHPRFEHLEAEALDGDDAQKIADALKAIRDASGKSSFNGS